MVDVCEHHVLRRSCQQCDDKETIADLKAQVAEKDRVIEVLAKYYCMVHNKAVNTGEEILPHEIIKEAEAEAKSEKPNNTEVRNG